MSTHLGKTVNNYGKKYGIVSTHLSGSELLSYSDLVPNSLIVSSPTLSNGEDSEHLQSSHSLFFTDYEGNAARLTYTIIPGNGLVVNAYHWPWNSNEKPYTVDTLTFEIDHDSLKTTQDKGQLYVSKPDIIDNYTLMVHQEFGTPHTYIGVITANLEKATDVKYGITRGDNYTISANDGILNVNTENLQYADDTLNHNGIVRCNPDTPENAYIRTIEAIDGVLKVITSNLDRASADTVGVVKPDFTTTSTDENGIISVLTNGLEYASPTSYGIVKPDNHTIQIRDNQPGVLYANAQNMTPTSIVDGESYFGVIKLDPISFGIDTANFTYVNRYPEIVALLNRYLKDYDYIISWLIDHENRITALENQAAAEYIYSFNNYGTNITTLDMPVWDEEARIVHSEEKFYSVQFSVNTNCKFHISVRYENNVSKPITLHSVRLGDNSVINASGLSQYVFESTNRNESTLNFTFLCDNYSSSGPEGKTPTTVILRVSSINDASIYKEGQHIFDRWNMTKFVQPLPPEPETKLVTSYSYNYVASDKCIRFVKSSNDNNTVFGDDYKVAQYVNNVNQGAKSNISFYYAATQTITRKTTMIVEKYIDGVLADRDESPVEDNTSYISYFSVPLITEYGRITSQYYLNYNTTLLSRNININENYDDGWETSDDTACWVSLSTTAIASTTGRTMSENAPSSNVSFTTASENTPATQITGGYNVLNLITTSAATSNDRKANIELTAIHPSDETWSNDKLIINYIDDVVINDCNINVEAMCRNNAETPLKIHVTKTPGSNPTGDQWELVIKYCLKTINGEAINSSNERIDSNALSAFTSQSSTSSNRQSTSASNNSEVSSQSQFESSLDTISIKINKKYDEFILNVQQSGAYATDKSGVTIGSEYIEITPKVKILPESVYNILANSTTSASGNTSSKTQSNVSNIYSSFQIISADANGFAANSSANDLTRNSESERNDGSPKIYCSSNGSWPTNYVAQQVTFGNATLNTISVLPWDDTRMKIEFTIRPGENTVIPNGSTISVQSSIAPNCVLFNGNVSYPYNNYYDNIILSNDGWTATGMKLNMILNNIPPVVPSPNSGTTSQVYVSQQSSQQEPAMYSINNQTDYMQIVTSQQAVVYNGEKGTQSTEMVSMTSPLVNSSEKGSSTRGTDGLSITEHNVLNTSAPMIQNITGMRFNFRLQAKAPNGETSVMDFAVSLNSLSEKVMISANYKNGASISKIPPMVNAFYNTNANITSSTEAISSSSSTTSVDKLAEEVDSLKDIINSLTSQTSSSTTQQTESQSSIGLKQTGVSSLVSSKAGTDAQATY